MTEPGFPLTWVGRTKNRKTGDVPTSYVGASVEECRASCSGCPLLDGTCYAWRGFAPMSLARIEARREVRPERYTLEGALELADPSARLVRIGAMGDPARADRGALLADVSLARSRGLGVLSYTHFWREPAARGLEGVCLASCEDVDEADDAIARGWIPAVLLPWDHVAEVGKTFALPSGRIGFVCPAQTRKGTTCNSCGLCDPEHPVWRAGKANAVGFLDHSREAREAKRRWADGRQLPILGRAQRDTRPGKAPPGL